MVSSGVVRSVSLGKVGQVRMGWSDSLVYVRSFRPGQIRSVSSDRSCRSGKVKLIRSVRSRQVDQIRRGQGKVKLGW